MRTYQLTAILCFCFCLLSIACNNASPQKSFEIAVLNSNMVVGFANERQLRELESPSVKLPEGGGEPVPMSRIETLQSKIDFVEGNLTKLKGLKETADTKEMLQTSIGLYEYILPIYKGEYQQLAKLYDENGSQESIQLKAQDIHDKYYKEFDARYNKLINIGKSFAQRHDIKVNWGE